MNMPSVMRLIGAAFFLAFLPVLGHALTPGEVFDKVKDSVVVVKTIDAQGKVKRQGSGVFLPYESVKHVPTSATKEKSHRKETEAGSTLREVKDPILLAQLEGKVATNCHVLEGGVSYEVGRGKQFISAILYAEDSDKDICVLEANGIEGRPAQLGRAANLKVGDPVYAVGAPRGLELSLSDGIVAQLRGSPSPLIQTTAAISPGSSGGGLFDKEGRLVGLTTFYLEGGQSLNFAMPVEWISEVKPGRKLVAEAYSEIEWLQRSIALEKRKDWLGLLDWSRKWTISEQKNPNAWSGLGIAYGHLKRYDEAVEAYRQALRIDPEYVLAWRSLGIAYGHLKRYDEAVEAYRQTLSINSEDAVTWSGLGIAYGRLDRYDDAIEALQQAVRINQEDDGAWYNLGIAYANSGNRTAALNAVKELRRLDPAKADKLFNLLVPR